MLQANFGTATPANSQRRKLGGSLRSLACLLGCCPGVARTDGRAGEGEGTPRSRAGGPRVSASRSRAAPRRLPPSPAREANESAAAAVSCFVAQVRGRAGAAPLHAGFPGTLPLAPLAARRRCLAPPATPYERIPNCSRLPVSPALPPPPPPPPCRGIAPRGSRRRCFEAQPGGRRGRARACVRRFCGTGLHQGGGKPGVERPSPSTRGPRGAQAGLAGPQRAGACGQPSAHLPRGDPGSVHGGVPGPSVPAQPARPERPGRKQGDLGQSLPFLQDEV